MVKLMITIKRLNKKYDGQYVLKDVNLHLKKGEFVFLQGSSGSGKSTLLKLLYRDIQEFEGDISLENNALESIPKYKTRRLIGTIFQSFELLDRKTVLENVALAGEVLGREEKEIKQEAIKLLDTVGLKGKENRFPHQLSGGEQQRVAIARALLNRPKIILADEPTGNLDPNTAIKIMELLKDINKKENITMFIVTHSRELMQAFQSRTILIENGEVKELEHT